MGREHAQVAGSLHEVDALKTDADLLHDGARGEPPDARSNVVGGERRVTAARDFAVGSEKANSNVVVVPVGGQDESSLGVVEFTGDLLHLGLGQTAGVEDDPGRVAGQGDSRERVHLIDFDRSLRLEFQLVSVLVANRSPVGLNSRTSALFHQVLSGKRRPISAQKVSRVARSRSRR